MSSGIVISIGIPGAAILHNGVGVAVLAGVVAVADAFGLTIPLSVLIGGERVAVSSLACVSRASMV